MDLFICQLCTKPYRSPVVICKCGHSFCEVCISEHFVTHSRCPTCNIKVELNIPNAFRPNALLADMVAHKKELLQRMQSFETTEREARVDIGCSDTLFSQERLLSARSEISIVLEYNDDMDEVPMDTCEYERPGKQKQKRGRRRTNESPSELRQTLIDGEETSTVDAERERKRNAQLRKLRRFMSLRGNTTVRTIRDLMALKLGIPHDKTVLLMTPEFDGFYSDQTTIADIATERRWMRRYPLRILYTIPYLEFPEESKKMPSPAVVVSEVKESEERVPPAAVQGSAVRAEADVEPDEEDDMPQLFAEVPSTSNLRFASTDDPSTRSASTCEVPRESSTSASSCIENMDLTPPVSQDQLYPETPTNGKTRKPRKPRSPKDPLSPKSRKAARIRMKFQVPSEDALRLSTAECLSAASTATNQAEVNGAPLPDESANGADANPNSNVSVVAQKCEGQPQLCGAPVGVSNGHPPSANGGFLHPMPLSVHPTNGHVPPPFTNLKQDGSKTTLKRRRSKLDTSSDPFQLSQLADPPIKKARENDVEKVTQLVPLPPPQPEKLPLPSPSLIPVLATLPPLNADGSSAQPPPATPPSSPFAGAARKQPGISITEALIKLSRHLVRNAAKNSAASAGAGKTSAQAPSVALQPRQELMNQNLLSVPCASDKITSNDQQSPNHAVNVTQKSEKKLAVSSPNATAPLTLAATIKTESPAVALPTSTANKKYSPPGKQSIPHLNGAMMPCHPNMQQQHPKHIPHPQMGIFANQMPANFPFIGMPNAGLFVMNAMASAAAAGMGPTVSMASRMQHPHQSQPSPHMTRQDMEQAMMMRQLMAGVSPAAMQQQMQYMAVQARMNSQAHAVVAALNKSAAANMGKPGQKQ